MTRALTTHQAAGAPAGRAEVWSCRGVRFVAARYVAHRYCPHFHDEYSIGVILDGVLGFRRGKAEFEAASGVISAINPGEVHTGCAETPGGWTARNILVRPGDLRDLLPEAFAGPGEPMFQAPIIEDLSVARRLLEAHRLTGQACSEFEKEAALVSALGALFLRHAPSGRERGTPAAGHPGTRRAAEYIRDNYAEPLSLAEAARAAGMSKHHFLRTFAREMDITPHAYLVQIRVREATRLLRSGRSISAAAAETGFADQSHFTRCFKRTMGVPPHLFLRAA
jgi:AraC-like DNA-binding protein